MVYDTKRSKLTLYGGYDGFAPLGDTWDWDGEKWAQRSSASPSPRHGAAGSFDSERGRVVMFGGWQLDGGSDVYLDETWENDGSAWSKRSPATKPAPKFHASMAYDPIRKRTVLFGGAIDAVATPGETWEWDGNTWSLRSTSGPIDRYGAAMGFAGGRIVLFGGANTSSYLGDTWSWDGAAWTQRNIGMAAPSARFMPAASVNPVSGKLVLYGGYASSGSRGDTWEYGP